MDNGSISAPIESLGSLGFESKLLTHIAFGALASTQNQILSLGL